MFLQEIFVVEDCVYYNPTGVTFVSNSSTDRVEPSGLEAFEYTPTGNFELTFDIDDTSTGKRFGLFSKNETTSTTTKYGVASNYTSNTKINLVIRTTTSQSNEYNVSSKPNTVKFVRNGNNTALYLNNVLQTTQSITWWDSYAPYVFKWGIWATGTATITNIKIKAL